MTLKALNNLYVNYFLNIYNNSKDGIIFKPKSLNELEIIKELINISDKIETDVKNVVCVCEYITKEMEKMPLNYKFIGFAKEETRHDEINPIIFHLHVTLIEFNNGENICNIEKSHLQCWELEESHIYKNINTELKNEILKRLKELVNARK